MRLTLMVLVMLLVVFAALAPSAMGETVITWDGGTGDAWQLGIYWVGGNAPNPNQVAKIANGTIPYVKANQGPAVCKRLVVKNESGSGSGVKVEAGGTLILGDGGARTSRLDVRGNVLEVSGTLKISGVQTFEGRGTLRLTDDGGASIVEATDASDLLVLTTECTSSPIKRRCSITLAGIGEVAVSLDNRAFVVADHDTYADRLHLTTRPKTTGNGAEAYWVCENGGTLFVETTVTGSGHWWVRDVDCTTACTSSRDIECNGTIEIPGNTGNGCVTGTGDVILEAGCAAYPDHQLKVKKNTFCTTGELTWRSVPVNSPGEDFMTRPSILVVGNASAQFGLSAPCDALVCSGG